MKTAVVERIPRQAATAPLRLAQAFRNPNVDPRWLARMSPLENRADEIWRQRQSARHAAGEQLRKSAFLETARLAPEALYETFRAKSLSYIEFDSPVRDAIELEARPQFLPVSGTIPGIVEPPGRGEMWWGETWYSLPNRIGMDAVFNDQGLVLTGALQWDDGDLYQSSLRIVSSYFLSPQRMPASNRVHSQPRGGLHGSMFGYTGGFLFLFGVTNGDHWSKSTLRTAQRAFSVNPNNPADAVEIAPAARSESKIVDIASTHMHQEAGFPGPFAYPAMELVIDHNRVLRIDLEVDLLLQLEGEASIRFGGYNSVNSLYTWEQWKLIDL